MRGAERPRMARSEQGRGPTNPRGCGGSKKCQKETGDETGAVGTSLPARCRNVDDRNPDELEG